MREINAWRLITKLSCDFGTDRRTRGGLLIGGVMLSKR